MNDWGIHSKENKLCHTIGNHTSTGEEARDHGVWEWAWRARRARRAHGYFRTLSDEILQWQSLCCPWHDSDPFVINALECAPKTKCEVDSVACIYVYIYIHIYHITNVCNIQCTYTSIIFYLKVLSMLEKECSSLFLVHSVLHPWCNEFYFKEVSPALLCASFREMPLVTGLVKPVPAKPCSARVEFMALGFYCEFITSQMTSVTVILGSCWKALRMIVGYPANAA